jgi:hypothetical protein
MGSFAVVTFEREADFQVELRLGLGMNKATREKVKKYGAFL